MPNIPDHGDHLSKKRWELEFCHAADGVQLLFRGPVDPEYLEKGSIERASPCKTLVWSM